MNGSGGNEEWLQWWRLRLMLLPVPIDWSRLPSLTPSFSWVIFWGLEVEEPHWKPPLREKQLPSRDRRLWLWSVSENPLKGALGAATDAVIWKYWLFGHFLCGSASCERTRYLISKPTVGKRWHQRVHLALVCYRMPSQATRTFRGYAAGVSPSFPHFCYLEQGSPNFCISYYTTVLGPDILRDVIISGYVTLFQINKFFFIYCIIFSLLTQCLCGRVK